MQICTSRRQSSMIHVGRPLPFQVAYQCMRLNHFCLLDIPVLHPCITSVPHAACSIQHAASACSHKFSHGIAGMQPASTHVQAKRAGALRSGAWLNAYDIKVCAGANPDCGFDRCCDQTTTTKQLSKVHPCKSTRLAPVYVQQHLVNKRRRPRAASYQ